MNWPIPTPRARVHQKRYEDVLDLLNAGISVITAVNIQHIESLNDVVARSSGIQVRETVPDWFLQRADEVVNVDVSVETLRTRLRQGKIYGVEKIEQSLSNFFRKGNLSTLRELALRQLAMNQSDQRTGVSRARGDRGPGHPRERHGVHGLAGQREAVAAHRVAHRRAVCVRLVRRLRGNARRRAGRDHAARIMPR